MGVSADVYAKNSSHLKNFTEFSGPKSHRANDHGDAEREKQLDSQDTSRKEMGEVPV